MRVIIDVDEKLWNEIMAFIHSKFEKPYSKSQKKVINEILKTGFKIIKEGNFEEVMSVLENYEVGDDFLDFVSNLSKSTRKRRMF
ncbi:MAG: hypothetical protein J7L47_00370 [Candidatus Odinarchaeota archaeon]|nr:hypothetical protein [Candidatus Odinarchaeota archaeon]